MTDPVITTDGQSYERAAITQWFEARTAANLPLTSPSTGARLSGPNADLIIGSVALKNVIDMAEEMAEEEAAAAMLLIADTEVAPTPSPVAMPPVMAWV